MHERIKDRLEELEKGMEELESFLPDTVEKYLHDAKTRAACERAFEKVMEAVIDISLLIIKYKKFDLPSNESGIFEVLQKNGILSGSLAKNLVEAKGMRNFIIHQYDNTDDELVFNSLSGKIEKDINQFRKSIKKYI